MFGRRVPPEDDEYQPDEDGPEAKLNREKAEQEVADKAAIECLIMSHRPEHAYWKLLSWATINKWNLNRQKKKR